MNYDKRNKAKTVKQKSVLTIIGKNNQERSFCQFLNTELCEKFCQAKMNTFENIFLIALFTATYKSPEIEDSKNFLFPVI